MMMTDPLPEYDLEHELSVTVTMSVDGTNALAVAVGRYREHLESHMGQGHEWVEEQMAPLEELQVKLQGAALEKARGPWWKRATNRALGRIAQAVS